eukprot:1153412-Pelagomonas_calceolata.AAC.3
MDGLGPMPICTGTRLYCIVEILLASSKWALRGRSRTHRQWKINATGSGGGGPWAGWGRGPQTGSLHVHVPMPVQNALCFCSHFVQATKKRSNAAQISDKEVASELNAANPDIFEDPDVREYLELFASDDLSEVSSRGKEREGEEEGRDGEENWKEPVIEKKPGSGMETLKLIGSTDEAEDLPDSTLQDADMARIDSVLAQERARATEAQAVTLLLYTSGLAMRKVMHTYEHVAINAGAPPAERLMPHKREEHAGALPVSCAADAEA